MTFERINKNLAEQLTNIQSSSVPENVQKLKEDFEKKMQDLKRTKDHLKKADENNKAMKKDIKKLNTRISSIENQNIRLNLTKNLATESLSKSNGNKQQSNLTTTKPKPQKCSFENSGICRRSNCEFFHPKGAGH